MSNLINHWHLCMLADTTATLLVVEVWNHCIYVYQLQWELRMRINMINCILFHFKFWPMKSRCKRLKMYWLYEPFEQCLTYDFTMFIIHCNFSAAFDLYWENQPKYPSNANTTFNYSLHVLLFSPFECQAIFLRRYHVHVYMAAWNNLLIEQGHVHHVIACEISTVFLIVIMVLCLC